MNTLARRRRTLDIWPGFVDALSSLILVMVFVLLLFAIGQFVLSQTLAGKNQALAQLDAQIAQLAKTLSLAQDSDRARCAAGRARRGDDTSCAAQCRYRRAQRAQVATGTTSRRHVGAIGHIE